MAEPPQSRGYALITGASSGIGEEFSRQLACRGWSLILVARSQDRLQSLAEQLMAAHPGIEVRSIAIDLSSAEAPLKLFHQTQAEGFEVALLINNAGFGGFGEFVEMDRARQRQMIDLNIGALVELSHLYLQPMYRQRAIGRNGGGIINIASVAGFAPLPYSAVYAATKAFVVSFSHAIAEEARQRGVHVMLVNPGSTTTNFFQVAGDSPFSHPMRMQTSGQVVEESLRAFYRRKTVITTGKSNRISVLALGLLPRKWITTTVGKVMRRSRSGK